MVDIRSAKRVEVGINSDGTKQYGDERDDKVRDHLLDCCRYSIGMRPALSRKQKKEDVPDGHIRLKDYEDESRMIEAQMEVERVKNWTGSRSYGY